MEKEVLKGIRITLCTMMLVMALALPVKATAMDQVVLQLRWEPQFQFSGYYAALWQGFYEEEGITVEIRPGFTDDGKLLQATEEVQAERAHFGVGAVDVLLANDQGVPLTVVATIFQRSPVAYYMLEETTFRTPVDLVGLKTARRRGDLLDIELQALLTAEGIDPGHIPFTQKMGSFVLQDLLSGAFDVVPVYLGSILREAEATGVSLKVLRPIDHGIDFYGDSLFTSRKLALENPELVERFRRATLKGWHYALENPETLAVAIADAFYPEADWETVFEYNLFQAEQVRELSYFPIVELGNMHSFRWETMHQLLSRLDMVQQPLRPEAFLFNYDEIIRKRSEGQRQLLLVTIIVALLVLSGVLLVTLASRNTAEKMKALFHQSEEENRKKEALMLYQARMAAMGEMVTNIAHQWRQPLNNLGLVLANLEDDFRHGELDDIRMCHTMDKGQKLIQRMSGTIDDFMQFSRPATEKAAFDPEAEVSKILELMADKCVLHGIHLYVHTPAPLLVEGYANEVSQALFNLIANGIDVLVERKPLHRAVVIHIEETSPWCMITVYDTGGGIPSDIIHRIGEPYFSTKSQRQGTGLGLYMAKTIIEGRQQGKLTWKNWEKGAVMTIWLPLAQKEDEA